MHPFFTKALSNALFFLNCLLVFLLVFESRLALPVLLQVSGKMHPLLLHFPIALLVFYAVINTFCPGDMARKAESTSSFLLSWGAFTAAMSAISGLFLSLEEGYDTEMIQTHKYTGAATSLLALLCYSLKERLQPGHLITRGFSFILLLLTTLAGHLGADITHGEGFLTAPLLNTRTKPQLNIQEADVFRDMIKPLLDEKCIGCHNSEKAKGDLNMSSVEGMLKGGKSGKL